MDESANAWNYDAKDVNTVADSEPVYGFQPGDMVSGERVNNFEDIDPDAQGWAVFSANNDQHGTITLNVSGGSPCNKKLMDLCNAHKEIPISVTTPHERVWSNRAKCQKAPGVTFGSKVGVRTYIFLCADYHDEFND